jgi:hypothetical protein
VSRVEAENSTALVSARADAEGLARKILLLESELVEERRAWETSEREHQERFVELTLLRLGAPCCVMPSSALLGQDICLRGCNLQPFAILKWSGNMPHFLQWCPLPQSQCSGAHLATLPARWW